MRNSTLTAYQKCGSLCWSSVEGRSLSVCTLVLSAVSIYAKRQGQTIEAPIIDAKRSHLRSMGTPHKMRGISIQVLQGLPQCVGPLHPRRSLSPRLALTASSRWLTREVELATARAALVSFRKGPLGLEATWSLPASKANPAALGTLRTHGCCCRRGTLTKVCSARGHQDLVSRKTFGRRCSTLGAPPLPHVIFRTVLDFGWPQSRRLQLAVQVGLPRRSPEGLTLWT